MFSKKSELEVLCIGSTSIDLFFPTDEGEIIETPNDITSKRKLAFELGGKVLVPELYTAVGGVSANVSQGLAHIGIKVGAYSCLGNDSNGKFCLQALKKSGIDTKNVQILADAQTDLSAIIVLVPGGERTIIHNRDANKQLIVEAEKLRAPWVFISALNGEWQKNFHTILAAQQGSKGPSLKIALNPGQHNIKEDSALILQVIRHADLLVLNKDEAIELVLYKDPTASKSDLDAESFLLKSLLQAGAKLVALTDGVRGAWVMTGQEYWFLPIPKGIKVVDSTGAGDAFTSGFFGAFLLSKPLDECLRFGMANSQAVIQEYGAGKGLLNRSELENAILHLIPQKLG